MHFHAHSRFSLRYGTLSVDELIDRAQAVGVTRLALTDIGTTSANWDFVRRAQEKGIEPVLGMDLRNGRERCFVALARHPEGYAALCRRNTTSPTRRTPRGCPKTSDGLAWPPCTPGLPQCPTTGGDTTSGSEFKRGTCRR
jgi:DNA polymerase III alpha subunit